ncbi:MAG TPA: SRPBCC family protein [Streptosporangiaceae bacterium]|nr:SRPBCC family protein [Streptosporangiaceae bacterium]
MAHYQASMESGRSAADTFDYLARFSNAAEWDPGVVAGEQLDPDPVGEGTRFRLELAFLGRRVSLTYLITQYVPGREVVLAAEGRLLKSTDRITVTAQGAVARVHYDADVRLQGPLGLLDPLLNRGFRTAADRAAAGLARALSTEHVPQAG